MVCMLDFFISLSQIYVVMAFPIENKLVVAVSSSALFDLSESDKIYNERGLDEYRRYQEQNIDNPLAKGVAFPFVKRLLSFNEIFSEEHCYSFHI